MEITKAIEGIWDSYYSNNHLIQMMEDWSTLCTETRMLEKLDMHSEESLFLIMATQRFILTINHRLEERNDFFNKYDQLFDTKITNPAFRLWYLSISALMKDETNNESLKLESMEKVIRYASLVHKNILPPPSFSQYPHIETTLVLSNCYSHAFKSGRYLDAESCLQAQFDLSTGQNYYEDEFLMMNNLKFGLCMKKESYPDALDSLKESISTCGSNSLQRLNSIRLALFCLKKRVADLEQNSRVVNGIIEISNFILLTYPLSNFSSLTPENISYTSTELKSRIVEFLKETKSPLDADPNIERIISKLRDERPELLDNDLDS